MELLNIGFALLVIKIALCILPGVLGIFFTNELGGGQASDARQHLQSTVWSE